MHFRQALFWDVDPKTIDPKKNSNYIIINFRHLPVIAKAIDEYRGAVILISHLPEFVSQIKFDQTLDLGSL